MIFKIVLADAVVEALASAAAKATVTPSLKHAMNPTLIDRTTLARERFFEHGNTPAGLVAEPVIRSWQRSLQVGLSPRDRPAFDPVSRSRARAAVERNHALIDIARPELESLERALGATGCRTLLTDARGVVIHAGTGPAVAGGVMEIACRVGVDLSEECIGSNAPGIVALCGDASTVLGAEHFFGALRECHCAAAPIRGRNGELVGVLDLSIEGRSFGFDALTQVKLSAGAIENRWLSRRRPGQILMRFHSDRRMLGTPLEALAMIDGDGTLASLNAMGRLLLGRGHGPNEPADDILQAESALGLHQFQWEAALRRDTPMLHTLPSGLQVWALFEADMSRVGAQEAPACEPEHLIREARAVEPLRDWSRRAIEAALACHGGNLSAAARSLGVSRGLLYRRLRQTDS